MLNIERIFRILWFLEGCLNPLLLIFEDSPISCNDRLEHRLGHLGFKTEPFPKCGIQNLIQGKLLQVVSTEHIVRHKIAGIRINRYGGTADKILDFSKEEKGFAKLFIRGKEEGS